MFINNVRKSRLLINILQIMQIADYNTQIWLAETNLVHFPYQYQINTFRLSRLLRLLYLRKTPFNELLEIKKTLKSIGLTKFCFSILQFQAKTNHYIFGLLFVLRKTPFKELLEIKKTLKSIVLTTFCFSLLQFQAKSNGYIFGPFLLLPPLITLPPPSPLKIIIIIIIFLKISFFNSELLWTSPSMQNM